MKPKTTALRPFALLWATQAFSALGSAMTNFALIIWTYEQRGSALTTALLSVCSYAPYVLASIFAGTLSDRWKKKAILIVSDGFSALCTVAVLLLLKTGSLEFWHLYLLNALSGLMNTVQQPASAVAVSLLAPREAYQRVGGLQAFSNSLVTVLTPAFASAMLLLGSLEWVILFDFVTCAAAMLSLALFIRIPESPQRRGGESVWSAAGEGMRYLRKNRGVLDLILFLASINLIASLYEAALPAMLLSRENAGETVLGAVNACTGLAALAGSIAASVRPAPKSRVKVIANALLFSMSTENLLLALGRTPVIWCAGAILGWLFIPVMNTNMDALLRLQIPTQMQGRVYSVRNTLQFFTIPVGYLLGGVLVDKVFEPLMAAQPFGSLPVLLFGTGKGSGAAALYGVLAVAGVAVCLVFRRDRHIWELEAGTSDGTNG